MAIARHLPNPPVRALPPLQCLQQALATNPRQRPPPQTHHRTSSYTTRPHKTPLRGTMQRAH
eukprot:9133209-Alexandrium_andersonii.AAC.1